MFPSSYFMYSAYKQLQSINLLIIFSKKKKNAIVLKYNKTRSTAEADGIVSFDHKCWTN